jgi:hypothetical protein
MGLLLLLQLVRRHARLLDCCSGTAVDHFVLTGRVAAVCLCTTPFCSVYYPPAIAFAIRIFGVESTQSDLSSPCHCRVAAAAAVAMPVVPSQHNGAVALSAFPAARLHRHALGSIFSFCNLRELSIILRVSREWASAVQSMHPLGADLHWRASLQSSRRFQCWNR